MKTSFRWGLWRCVVFAWCALAWAGGVAQEAFLRGSPPSGLVSPPPAPVEGAPALPWSPLRVSYEAGTLFLGFATGGAAREIAIEYSVDLRMWVAAEVGWAEGGPPPAPPIELVESVPRAPGQNLRILPVGSFESGLGFYRTVWRAGVSLEAGAEGPGSRGLRSF